MNEAREGTSMMEAMVKRFDEAQAKIKSLEVENMVLATQMMDAFERVTINARYDLLMLYKQWLFNETEIDEELELYKDDFGCSSSAPANEVMPSSSEQLLDGVEPLVNPDPLEDHEARE